MRELTVRNLVLTRAGVDALMSLQKLESLKLQGNTLTDDAWSQDGPATTIASLSIIDNVGVTRLPAGRFIGLTGLCLSGTGFNDDGVAGLVPLSPSITILSLQRSNVTDAGMSDVVRFQHLMVLDLQSTQVGEAGISTLRNRSFSATVYVSEGSVQIARIDELKASKQAQLTVMPIPNEFGPQWFQSIFDILK